MGQHLTNPVAQAKARGEEIIRVAPLGDGYAFANFQIAAMTTPDGELAAVLVAHVGKESAIVGMKPTVVPIAELGKIKIEDLKKAIDAALAPKPEIA